MKITDFALLIYSPLEVRVAIVDLRPIGFPLAFAANERRTLHGAIASLPLVDGEYDVGCGIRTSDFAGDSWDYTH